MMNLLLAGEKAKGLHFTLDNVVPALYMMAIGIAGVFIVLIAFYLIIKLMGKLFPEKPE